MKKLEKLLDSFNILLEHGIDGLKVFLTNLTPKNAKKFYKEKKESIVHTKDKVKHYKSDFGKSSKELIKKSLDIQKQKTTAMKEMVQKAKSTDFKKIDYKKGILAFFAIIAPFFLKIQKWFLALKPTTILTFTLTGTVGALTSIEVYKSATQKEKVVREVANETIETEVISPPSYYHMDAKTFELDEVTMPIFIEKVTDMKTLRIDLSFETSNRYIKAYFEADYGKQKNLIRNKINSTLEPIVPEFPLEEEGKRVIETKVKNDVDELLKDLNIEGKIEKVLIKNILAG